MNDGPLDMRMDKEAPLTAEEVVNEYDAEALLQIIRDYGEERWAKRIVEFIVNARQEKRITTTGELVRIIKQAIPAKARQDGPHPAKRTFQAIRIEVNRELAILHDSFVDAVSMLKPKGKIGGYHISLLGRSNYKTNFQRVEYSMYMSSRTTDVCM